MDMFELQKDCRLPLYINTPPCGDVRNLMLSVKKENPELELDLQQKKKRRKKQIKGINSRQILTCFKLKNARDIAPISSKESIQNEKTRDHLALVKEAILYCSDKLSLANVVGVQGALLSHFCSLMYFTSITIGRDKSSDRNIEAIITGLGSAIHSRFEGMLNDLPEGYRCDPCLIYQSSVDQHASATRNNLIRAMSGPKVGVSQKEPSKISKLSLFRMFTKIVKSSKISEEQDSKILKATFYFDAKNLAKSYQLAKTNSEVEVKNSRLGRWSRQHPIRSMFTVQEDSSTSPHNDIYFDVEAVTRNISAFVCPINLLRPSAFKWKI
ncbi:hypothetical protein QYM36_017950 [Artemia franciscana]|uniref:A to I editase domain-containing protein n=1 Tax=Artemia franciscana TaxID=6661 RepID=A0AA88H5E2_ARTSF|nr:hypothetical protein QYM36_017950 [Artemia franciscana]